MHYKKKGFSISTLGQSVSKLIDSKYYFNLIK